MALVQVSTSRPAVAPYLCWRFFIFSHQVEIPKINRVPKKRPFQLLEGPLLIARNENLLDGVQPQGNPAAEPVLLGFLNGVVTGRLNVSEPALQS